MLRATLVALATTIAALAVRLSLEPWLESHAPLMLFLLAVFASATTHGALGGVLATVFGAIAGALFLLAPDGGLAITENADRVRMVIFCTVGTLISLTSGRLGEARQRLRREIAAKNEALVERDRWLERERRARTAAEKLAHLRDEFVSTVSHELRTPMNAILGFAVVLRQRFGPHDAKLAHGLEVIERNARAQTKLIDDMLDLGRSLNGSLALEERVFDLRAPVQRALDTLRVGAHAKDIEVRLEAPDGPLPVLGDEARIAQVVWNLVANAMKFSARGGRIDVRLARDAESVVLDVKDEGEGIDPAFLPHVFDRFRQEDGSHTRNHGGLGIGLAIVRQLVEMHGGSIDAASEGRGRGARFSMRLPLAPSQEKTETLDEATDHTEGSARARARRSLEGARVLLVEDDDDSREIVREVLAASGAEVDAAPGAEPALALLRGNQYDVLVSDLGMPGRDGCSLVREVRASRLANRSIPAIAISGLVREEDRRASLDAGFDRHLGKPVDPSRLTSEIASVLRRTGPMLDALR